MASTAHLPQRRLRSHLLAVSVWDAQTAEETHLRPQTAAVSHTNTIEIVFGFEPALFSPRYRSDAHFGCTISVNSQIQPATVLGGLSVYEGTVYEVSLDIALEHVKPVHGVHQPSQWSSHLVCLTHLADWRSCQ